MLIPDNINGLKVNQELNLINSNDFGTNHSKTNSNQTMTQPQNLEKMINISRILNKNDFKNATSVHGDNIKLPRDNPQRINIDSSSFLSELSPGKKINSLQYISTTQGRLRCVVVNLIHLICTQAKYKRRTFHGAITNIDLSGARNKPNLDNNKDIIILGLVILSICAKYDEESTLPREKYLEFLQCYELEVTKVEFNNLERQVFENLNFNISQTTLLDSFNSVLLKWSEFTKGQYTFMIRGHMLSYIHYRQYNQGIDTILHDYQYMNYSVDQLIYGCLLFLFLLNNDEYYFSGKHRKKYRFDKAFWTCYLIEEEDIDINNQNTIRVTTQMKYEFLEFGNREDKKLGADETAFSDQLIDVLVYLSKYIGMKFIYANYGDFEPRERVNGNNYNEYLNDQTKIESIEVVVDKYIC